MKTRKHKVLDHPVLGYFLLILFVLFVTGVFSRIIDGMILGKLIPGYAIKGTMLGEEVDQTSGVGNAVGSVVAISIFYLWFRPYFEGMLKKKDILRGLLLMIPVLVIHWIGSVVSWVQFGTANILLAFLMAAAPGFSEETAFRGLGVANYMRKNPTEKGVVKIFWLSSVVFGLVHVSNALAGAPLWVSVVQAAYAVGVGMALGAVYLRTGNLWPTIIAHMSMDFLEFIRADLGGSGGVMSKMGVGDWITILAGAVGIVVGLYLVRPAKREEIVELWKSKFALAKEEDSPKDVSGNNIV